MGAVVDVEDDVAVAVDTPDLLTELDDVEWKTLENIVVDWWHRGVDGKSFHLGHHACWTDAEFQILNLFVTEFQPVNEIIFHESFDCALRYMSECYMKHLQRVQITIRLVMSNPSVSLGLRCALLDETIADRDWGSPFGEPGRIVEVV